MKAALILLGVGAAAAVVVSFLLRRSAGAVNTESGATLLPEDTPLGAPIGKITDIDRNSFSGFTFRTTLTNPDTRVRTVEVAVDFVPSGGLQIGVDPFHVKQIVTIPARSNVGVDFIDEDLFFAPFASGEATLSVDGIVVDKK